MISNSFNRFEFDINDFEMKEMIDQGGFGTVFLAINKKINKKIAAKTVITNGNPKLLKMIHREVDIMMYVNHPTIIKFYGYTLKDFQNRDNITILMEYASNGSLAKMIENIQNKKITNTTRQIILAGIARGMKYLHDRNIIHRDLKPKNILLDDNYYPIISDFGLSKFFDQEQSAEQTDNIGTYIYMAPEFIVGENYDLKVDVYSFGILMYEVVTNSFPYPELLNGKMNIRKVIRKVIKENYRPVFNQPIKDSIRQLIEKCWSTDPNERPTFKEIFHILTNKTDSSENDFFLDDVDLIELEKYVKMITKINDPIEELLSKNDKLEEIQRLLQSKYKQIKKEKQQLLDENQKLKAENEQLKQSQTEFVCKNSQIMRENAQLKEQVGKLNSIIYHSSSSLTEKSSYSYSSYDQSTEVLPPLKKKKIKGPFFGIDLGTSYSTIGIAQFNAKEKEKIYIVPNSESLKKNPSVVCIVDDEIYVGKEAIRKSSKYPKNLIYDSKRMLGRKFDDPLIQEYRKHWTFDTVKSKTGGILISVDNKLYEPYEISGMILTELVNLANSHLETNINQAIITIPAYFDQMQIDDTRRAAKYANIEIIQLLDEQLAATICYKNNYNSISSERNKNVLVYDFGGGTLDVSYVEIEGSSFKVLAAAGDSGLGGQDFTNSIFDIISPKLEKMCKPEWKKDSWFLSLITNQCETAKISLTRLNEVEIYFEIPKNLSKSRENTFEYRLRREEFEEKTKELFDRCTAPVIDVLKRVGRNPLDIESLVLVGGSSYLPKIVKKLYELTQKKAYHGVSPVEAVAYGACCKGLINKL